MKNPQEIVQTLEKLGVTLSVNAKDTSKLSIEMQKDLTPNLFRELRENKEIIIKFLLSQTNSSNEPVVNLFDELGYVSDKYDHLSEQSNCVQVEAVTPQQVLGIVEIGLERKVFDHLRRYGACQLKTAAKEMNENEQAIRQVVQNSTLVEYRKGVDECGAWESLLPNEIDYPARFVVFIESQEKVEIDDVFVLLEQCEAYIRQHDQEYLKEWLDFFSRVVRFYRVDVPLLTSLRDAWRFRDTENAIWV